MDKSDLEEYQLQLNQVETALEADPDNAELASLRSELKQLIELAQAAIAQAEAAAAASSSKQKSSSSSSGVAASATPQHTWSAGDECLARYSGDGQWYPARITFVGGAPENRVYSIVFKGYNTTELVKGHEVKPYNPNQAHAGAAAHAGAKRKLTKDEEEERDKKKKKNEKKLAMKAEKAKEQQEKQQSWQKFAKKSEKKGQASHIAGVVGKSIFKTPDNPMGRVGVTGSGRGMTEVAGKSKHKFEYGADDS